MKRQVQPLRICLRLCAYLAPDAIAQEIITTGAAHLGPALAQVASDALLFGHAMEALRAYSLIGRDPGRQTLSVHRLMQAVVRDGMEAADRQCWAERAVRAVRAALPAVQHANWPRWERLLAHAQACTEWIEPEGLHPQEAARALQQAGWYLTQRARYSEAEPLFERALAIREQTLGSDHPETAISYFWLAYLAHQQQRYEAAEPLYQKALSIRERRLGPHHPLTSSVRSQYVSLLRTMGRNAEARALETKHLPTL